MIDFNKHVMKEARASDAITDAIDKGLMKKQGAQKPRTYLGASSIGDACVRRTQFEYAGAAREKPFEGKTLRIFDRGHVFEELARGWLIDAGFTVKSWNSQGEQFGFSQLDGKFRGHCDGVLIDGPEIAGVDYPCLWEHKAVGAKTFNAVAKHGLAKERPVYADQVAIYQAYLTLTENPCIFTITNADSCEQLHLLIPYDAERAQHASDRAVLIVRATEAGELLPRPFANADFFECKWCAFAKRCWELPS
jgi:hypothetical protein